MTDEEMLKKYSWLRTVGEINDESPWKEMAIRQKLALLRSFERIGIDAEKRAAKVFNDYFIEWQEKDNETKNHK